MNTSFFSLLTLISSSIILGTRMDNSWYKPQKYQPPGYVFQIVWILLYSFLIITHYQSSSHVHDLIILTLSLQVLWLLTFNTHHYQTSKVVLGVIVITALLLLLFTRSPLILFYLGWTLFAFYLCYNIEPKD